MAAAPAAPAAAARLEDEDSDEAEFDAGVDERSAPSLSAEQEEEEQPDEELSDLAPALIDHLGSLATLVKAHDPKAGSFRAQQYIKAINSIKRFSKAGGVLTRRTDFEALCQAPQSPLALVGKKTREKYTKQQHPPPLLPALEL